MNRTQNKDLRFDYSVRFSASDFPAAIICETETVLFALRAAGYDPVDQLY